MKPKEHEPTFLTVKEFIAGWIAGICGLLSSHPIDTIKVNYQYAGGTISHALATTYKRAGIRGFFHGIGFPSVMAGIQNAVFFGVYANTIRYLKVITGDHNKHPDLTKVLIAGNCAGFVQVMATTPVEIIKIRLQTRSTGISRNPHTTIIGNMRHIYRLDGISGFYRGYFPTVLRDVPSGGLYMAIYINTNEYFEKHMGAWWSHLISGGIAGAASYACVIPFDVIKTKMQADSVRIPKYKGFIDCIQKVYKKRGFGVFWRGFIPSCIRSFVCNATVFVLYEYVLLNF